MSKGTQNTARSHALFTLQKILAEGRLIAEVRTKDVLSDLVPADRARSLRLVQETLRGLERADKILKPFLQKKPPLIVQNVLRLGVVELVNAGDAHGVVNEYVTIIGRNKKHQSYKGLVNAVLRKVSNIELSKWHDLRIPRLPRWLRDPLLSAYDNNVVSTFEQVHFQTPPVDLACKVPKDAEKWAKRLGGTVVLGQTVRLEAGHQISALEGFDSGDWWVQDAAAQLPQRLLGDVQGKAVLDLCAAPGGKTMQLVSAGANVTAVDVSEKRIKRLQENLNRTHLDANVVTSDVFDVFGQYDAILLDAPCSATGTIRRHPDLPHAKTGDGFFELFALQSRMIDKAISLLKPNGVLLFCTCSLLPDEGECQVEDALARHKELKIDSELPLSLSFLSDWKTAEGGYRTRPDYLLDQGGLDGFYMARLIKH